MIYILTVYLIVITFINLPFMVVIDNFSIHTVNFALFALLLSLILSLYLMFLPIFALPIILIENNGIFSSIKKSLYLIWGNWFKVFVLQITPLIVYFLTIVSIKSILCLYIYLPDISNFLLLSIYVILMSIFMPFQASLLLLQLRDLELRKNYNC
ncbi:hypothetical protein N9L02_02325 [Gammaproteobacteria bacterium]|nr:hypothetical protein [Gammaproteobacteria bacterium]